MERATYDNLRSVLEAEIPAEERKLRRLTAWQWRERRSVERRIAELKSMLRNLEDRGLDTYLTKRYRELLEVNV